MTDTTTARQFDSGREVDVPPEVNIRSSNYFIARSLGACGHCRTPTQVFALAVPPGHQTLEFDAHSGQGAGSGDIWRIASHTAFVFYIEYLPEAVQGRVRRHTQCYRFGHDAAAMSFYWANHCESCGCLLEDHELFCEPDGAFLPTGESSASSIQLWPMHEPLQALAAGYVCDPQFFDAMSRD